MSEIIRCLIKSIHLIDRAPIESESSIGVNTDRDIDTDALGDAEDYLWGRRRL